MMKVATFLFMLSEYSHSPQIVPGKIVTLDGIHEYTNSFPDVCAEYIKQAKNSEPHQINVNPEIPFQASQHKSSNSMVAACYTAIPVYPDGNMWSFIDFINLLNIIEFDVALYLFSMFYQTHSDDPRFYLDFEKSLISLGESFNESPFLKNFHNLNRLFTIYKVNELLHTDIINIFIKDTLEINLK